MVLRGMPLRFTVMMRGYDRAEVDQLLARAEQAAGSSDAGLRAAVSSELQAARLRDCLRGYSRSRSTRRSSSSPANSAQDSTPVQARAYRRSSES